MARASTSAVPWPSAVPRAGEAARLTVAALALYAAFALGTFPADLHPADTRYTPIGGWGNLLPLWGCFALSVVAWHAAGADKRSGLWAVVGAAAASLLVGWPILTADPREYILLAHAEALGLDPLRAPYGSVAAMAEFPPMRMAAYPRLLDPYGPAFWALMRLWAVFPWQAGIWAWRAAMAGLYVGTARLWLGAVPSWARRGFLAAYGSPFAALSLAGGAHNVMLVLALAALALRLADSSPALWRDLALGGALGLMLSFTLLGAGVAAGLWGLVLGRRGARSAALSAAVAAAVFLLGYAAYGGTPLAALHDWVSPHGQSRQVFVSLASAFGAWPGGALADTLTRAAAALAAFGLVIAALAVIPAAARAGRRDTLAWALPLAAALPLAFVGSVMPWYALPALTLAAALGNPRPGQALVPYAVSYGGAIPLLLVRHVPGALGIVSWGLVAATAAAYALSRAASRARPLPAGLVKG
ncbi:MAG: hypothetical protein K6V73_06340 [Firmicutes bacterium]|nr:hypothetical protein [Bacillota bacterium]